MRTFFVFPRNAWSKVTSLKPEVAAKASKYESAHPLGEGLRRRE
jgi:hypothetical protein